MKHTKQKMLEQIQLLLVDVDKLSKLPGIPQHVQRNLEHVTRKLIDIREDLRVNYERYSNLERLRFPKRGNV